MGSKISKGLTTKIKLLEEYLSTNKMNEYSALLDADKITEEEAVYLYDSSDLDKDMKSFVYFLLSEEDKLQRIEDISTFPSFFNYCLRYVNDNSQIKAEVYKQMSRVGYINGKNISMALQKVGDLELCREVLSNVINRGDIPKCDAVISEILFSAQDEYRVQVAKKMFLDNMDDNKRGFLEELIIDLSDEQLKKQMLFEYVKQDDFVEKNDEWHIFFKLKRILQGTSNEFKTDFYEFVSNNGNSINNAVKKEYVLAISSPEYIVDSVKKDKSINLQMVAEFVLYQNRKSFKPGDKELLDVYFNDDRIEEMEKWKLIYSNFENEGVFECAEFFLNTCNKIEDKSILLDLFDNIEARYDINKYPSLRKEIINISNVKNERNFNKLCDKFGTQIINYLKIENFVDLINLSDEEYDKIMSLFDEENLILDNDSLNTIVNSLLQRQFRIEQSEDYNIFSRLEQLLQEKNDYTISEVASLLNKIGRNVNISSFETEKELLIPDLFDHNKESMDMLHKLTSAYIAKRREMYTAKKKNVTLNSLNVEKYYNKTYIKKAYISNNSESYIMDQMRKFRMDMKEYDSTGLLYDQERLERLIALKKYGAKGPLAPELKEDIKIFDGILDKLYEAKALRFEYMDPEDAKYEYIFKSIGNKDLLEMISGISVKHVSEVFDKNDELYNKLNNFMRKYKFIGWGDTFGNLADSSDIQMDKSIVYSMINNFDKIHAMMSSFPEKNQTLTALIDCATAYSSSPKKYSKLIGKENFDYIYLNPGPNQSVFSKDIRVSFIPEHFRNMYERNSVTVPSGEMLSELSDGRNIKFSIGDIYNPIAMTYGERTGACLRIKGAFDDLYSYCLADKNGFHIRFEDPETGEFVSRVTGIRNGNTVFLNELRESVVEQYNSQDLVETLQKIAKFLVESTKNDPHPIENVIVSNDLAMSAEKKFDLKIDNIKEAFNGLNFNITNEGNVLYTANEDPHELVPYKFGDEYVSEYRPYNNYAQVVSKEDVEEVVNRVHMLNELLKGEEFGGIEQISIEDAVRGICGHGWVVYVDSKNKVHELVIDKFKKDKKLRALIDENKKKYLGGEIYEQSNR